MNKILYIIRGIPGSGKSTFAKSLGLDVHLEADSFFMVNKNPITGDIVDRHVEDGKYVFDPSKIKEAHLRCQQRAYLAMERRKPKIGVSNTFTEEWEMEPYRKFARQFGYKIFSVIVENRHGGQNQHDVPDQVIAKMRDRFDVKL